MRRYLYVLALTLLSCSKSPDTQKATPAPTAETPVAPPNEIPLVELPAQGSQMRFMDALALTEVYSRVFTRSADGRWKGCGNDAGWCQKSMFSKVEAKTLGTFSLYDGVDSFRVMKDFTLNYTRNLRALLARECKNQVDIEWARVTDPAGVKLNHLIFRQGVPELNDLNQFSQALFGVEGTAMVIDNDAATYRTAFQSAVGSKTDAATLKSSYVVLCMALAMDPAVYLY